MDYLQTDSGNKKPALLIRRGGSLGAIAFAVRELRGVIVPQSHPIHRLRFGFESPQIVVFSLPRIKGCVLEREPLAVRGLCT